jgi:hypothetical protein
MKVGILFEEDEKSFEQSPRQDSQLVYKINVLTVEWIKWKAIRIFFSLQPI